ncbi:MAG TPA: tetratricopeptide repeat protein [Candidatus Udaeobacter sp.]|nr:tetratricopeptide repeat protein [Candidatus Udaeobacter sp.]
MTQRLLAIVLVLMLMPAPRAAVAAGRHEEAAQLYDQAIRHLAQATFDTRRMALDELEQATLLDPGNAQYELTLARAYLQAGHLRSARTRFERVARITPEDAPTRFGLGVVWRRDWLKYLDRTSLDHAVENFSYAARLDASYVDAWLMLTPLLIEQGKLPAARAAARHALDQRPDVPETELAAAYTEFRSGEVERAESLFIRAIPRLRPDVRARFDDISPVASERDTAIFHRLGVMDQMEFRRRFWKENDPDPATPENEAQLEYWSRVTQAYFLYYDAKHHQWDERGEVYVRYGPPEHAEYNPVGYSNRIMYGGVLTFVGDAPANTLVWSYPALGMNVVMQDWLLSERYLLPTDLEEDDDPRPDPRVLQGRDDALATHDLKGVFPVLPPGARPLPVIASLTRFPGDQGGRIVESVEAPGVPGDSLWAEWVVLDSSAVEIARARRALSPSACDPTAARVADFAAALPPGSYRASISVRSRNGGRGVARLETRLDRSPAALSLSDVMIACGPPDLTQMPVRPAANPAASVAADEPLQAYFEIDHLALDRDGRSRFEYVYSVRSAEKDPRIWLQRVVSPRPPVPSITASREDENMGSLRRQFVSVPVQPLPPGRYWLDIRVRDLVSGDEARAEGAFRKAGPAAPSPAPSRGHAGAGS